MLSPVVARDAQHLKELVHACIAEHGPTCDLNHIDVSDITDMSDLFMDSPFNGDISRWDVSHVTDMSRMFRSCRFKGDISGWDVSNVIDMVYMFDESYFNGDLSKWDISSVDSLRGMFHNCDFAGDLSSWDTSHVRDMASMFASNLKGADKDVLWNIGGWDVSRVEDMSNMFRAAAMAEDISRWNVGSVTNARSMFEGAYQIKDVGAWNFGPGTNIWGIFERNEYGLRAQTPNRWNIPLFLESDVLPSDEGWAKAFAAVAAFAQTLGLPEQEHAQCILDEYVRQQGPANEAGAMEVLPLPEDGLGLAQ